ncbi:MAG: arginine N-succinyltransferase [Gammaproteobacteria bacterium]|nr:arginine N-succinyltransferase [Gammaproteobacteria bacterium]
MRARHVVWIVLATVLVTAALTFWALRTYIYARDFTPVELAADEQQVLDGKLRALGYEPAADATVAAGDSAPGRKDETDQQWLRPERYAEDGAPREVNFSERELNALLANNRDIARKLAVDLADDLVSARLLVPVDPDFPVLGGKTLRVAAGVEMAFRDARPVVVLKGVSVMGIPIPNAWLGGLKNIDLIGEFGDQGGFWQGFADGVDNIRVEEGKLKIRLRE